MVCVATCQRDEDRIQWFVWPLVHSRDTLPAHGATCKRERENVRGEGGEVTVGQHIGTSRTHPVEVRLNTRTLGSPWAYC